MHLETFLYMLLQSDKTLPPPGVKPDFKELAHDGRKKSSPNPWVIIPPRTVTIGQNESTGFFAWDNEKPMRSADVSSFEAKARPLTNGDYAKYLAESGSIAHPKSWIIDMTVSRIEADEFSSELVNGYSNILSNDFLQSKAVRTVYGPVSLIFALDWPVMGSYDELAACAAWFGGRIPTFEEAKSIYTEAEARKAPNEPSVSETFNGDHLWIESLHADLRGCNVSFSAFHPMPVTLQADNLAGLSGMGGVWEWTSSPLDRWEGFEVMPEYPGYTGTISIWSMITQTRY